VHDAMKYRNAAENVFEMLRPFENELVELIKMLQCDERVEMRSMRKNVVLVQHCYVLHCTCTMMHRTHDAHCTCKNKDKVVEQFTKACILIHI